MMPSLIPTDLLLKIVRTAAPTSPVVRNGLVVLSLCAIGAIIRRSFANGSEALVTGLVMFAAIVVVTVISYIANTAPNPVVRFCAHATALVLTFLFLASCVLICSRFFFGWPPPRTAITAPESTASLKTHLQHRLRLLQNAQITTNDAIDRFLDQLDGMPWADARTQLTPLMSTLQQQRSTFLWLIAGALIQNAPAQKDLAVAQPALLIPEPQLLSIHLAELFETLARLDGSPTQSRSSLGTLVGHFAALRVLADSLPSFLDYPTPGARGVVKGSNEYISLTKAHYRQSLSYTKNALNDSMIAIRQHELVQPLLDSGGH